MTGLVPLLAGIFDDTSTVVIALALVAVFFLSVLIWASRYTKVGPNEVLVISGRRHTVMGPGGPQKVGFRIVRGGGVFVWPVVERVDILSLEIMTLDVKTPEVYPVQGVPMLVDGGAEVQARAR